jgi:uncharacterized protein
MVAWSLKADGQDVTALIQPLVLTLEIVDDVKNESDRLTLELAWIEGLKIPKKGVILEFMANKIALGKYVVQQTSGAWRARNVRIQATGTPLNLPQGKNTTNPMQTQRSRTWPKNMMFETVIKTVAKTAGLNASVSKELAPLVLAQVTQRNESDLHLVQRLCRDCNAYFKINGGTLICQTTDAKTTVTGATLTTHPLKLSDLEDFSFDNNGRGEETRTVARYRTKGTAKTQEVTAGGDGTVRRLKAVYASQAEANTAAKAEQARQGNSSRTMRLTLASVRFDIFALHRIKTVGFPRDFDGLTRKITSVTHHYGRNGWQTTIELEGDS